ncbi:MAG: nicotinate (nicotinamide) nucleotide adenylyltransferase [Christensenellales bacterium]
MQKTLVFGGAFDPPHLEHANVCKHALKQLGISKLVLVPTFSPPHKSVGFLDFDERCELLKIAFDGFDFEIDDIENVRKKDNYTALTLPLLKQKYGDIVYLVGGDSLEYFSTWYKPEKILQTCPIAVCAREGFKDISECAKDLQRRFGGEIILLDYVGKEVSSSAVRAKLLMGEKTDELDQRVRARLDETGAFAEYADMVQKLRSYQTDELFEHSKAVVLTAMELNSRHNLKQDFTKTFLACFLHDNAKQRPSIDGLSVPPDMIGTPVLHQFLGAEKARRDFGIEDRDVLDAIRYHTTAKADMTMLEKLVYTADSLSFDRNYEPIPALREIAMRDFDEGFKAVLRYTYDKVTKSAKPMHPLTAQAVECYLG